jgi:glutamyl-tRNA reductase
MMTGMNKRDEVSEIILLGLSHKTAPLEIREKFTFDDVVLKRFHERSKKCGIDEMVYLATCNRVEIYFTAREIHRSIEKLMDLLVEFTGLSRDIYSPYIYKKYSRDVVLHLLTVASSLDSMVIGENEILGQIKQAYRDSVLHKNSGLLLNRLFHQSFNTAKKVRTHTGISQNPLSIAYIAVELAREKFGGDLSDRKALLIGAGEMGELILKYLTKNNIKDITIANRSLHNAETVVERINKQAHIVPLSDIASIAPQVDIIITSVTCHDYLLTYPMIESIAGKRGDQPLFIIDIAVPRNVDPEVENLNNVILYNIDNLKEIADRNLESRLNEADAAMDIVHADANDLLEWYEGLEMVPMIVKMQESFDRIREAELSKYRRRQLKNLSEEDMQVIDDLTKQIISKILHNPIMAIKENSALNINGYHNKEDIKQKIQIIEELFKI